MIYNLSTDITRPRVYDNSLDGKISYPKYYNPEESISEIKRFIDKGLGYISAAAAITAFGVLSFLGAPTPIRRTDLFSNKDILNKSEIISENPAQDSDMSPVIINPEELELRWDDFDQPNYNPIEQESQPAKPEPGQDDSAKNYYYVDRKIGNASTNPITVTSDWLERVNNKNTKPGALVKHFVR